MMKKEVKEETNRPYPFDNEYPAGRYTLNIARQRDSITSLLYIFVLYSLFR